LPCRPTKSGDYLDTEGNTVGTYAPDPSRRHR
jgi:hypothetical protein